MARRDFRGADLSDLDLRNRDFTGAHFDKANARGADFSGSTLQGAHTVGMQAPSANLARVTAPSSVFVNVDFNKANLREGGFDRSHFTKVDLRGADLRGTSFRNAHFNQGTDLDGALTDSETVFDGATILRPLARQPAFRFYRVERGVLIRNEGSPTDVAESSGPQPGSAPAGSASAAKSVHFNTDGPPQFLEGEGEFAVDYRSHDGRIIFGRDDWLFDTRWTTAGDGSIHSYRETNAGIAVARDVTTIADVMPAVIAASDFTSSVATPSVGEVLLLMKPNGHVLAIEIHKVKVTAASRAGAILAGRYRILVDGSQDSSSDPGTAARTALIGAIDGALRALIEVPVAEEDGPAGMGHNGPPADAALTAEDQEAVRTTLIELRAAASISTPDRADLHKARESLSAAGDKILSWGANSLAEVHSGFFKHIGASLAGALASYFVLSGALAKVVTAIGSVLGS